MSTEYDYPGTSRPAPGRHAFEWGLASMLTSMTLALLFPLSLIVIGLGGALASTWTYWDPDNLRLADVVAHIVGYLGITAAVLALLFAVFGLLRGMVGRQPLGACVGGLCGSVAALVLMVALMIIIGTASKEFYKELPRRQRHHVPADFNGR
jgi:hypothetical protein